MLTGLDLLMRTLASPTRLRILTILHSAPQDPLAAARQPRSLALALRIAPSTVTFHLKTLLRLRLVRYLKVQRYKFYALARGGRGTARGRLLERVLSELPGELGPVPAHPSAKPGRALTRPKRHSDAGSSPLGDIWTVLTSFSHFRRLLMLQALRSKRSVSFEELRGACRLSEEWTLYHVDKLERRGVIRGGPSAYRLSAKPPGNLQAFLNDLLGRELARAE